MESNPQKKLEFDPKWLERGYGSKSQAFQTLMRYRISNILLVSSLYDLFLFEEDGRLYELLREEYQGLNLSHAPELTRVSSGRTALALAKKEQRFDLIITTLHVDDMTALKFAERVRKSNLNIPIVLLAYDRRELSELILYDKRRLFDEIFVWQGDFRIVIAILKLIEDKLNFEHDMEAVGVQTIILVEDQVRYYSSFLPHLYVELFYQAQRLISEGISLSHKFMRMRARPKILLATNYEDAWRYFQKCKEHILGVISDIDFTRKGRQDPQAGIKLTNKIKNIRNDLPVLLQSDLPENEQKAYDAGASFALKGSPTLLQDLRNFMFDHFGFGDFVFRNGNQEEIGRATDLRSLEDMLRTVPEESILYHSEHNHFSNWLKARTEFWLAHQLRPRQVEHYPSAQALREDLIASVRDYRRTRQFGVITDFKKGSFYPLSSFARIGGGSLGGKARGLSFINKLIHNYKVNDRFKQVQIYVPPSVVLGTDVFDEFLDENNLRGFALKATDDQEVVHRFLRARKFPAETVVALIDFLDVIRTPLAVRSSSLLEDSQYYPFAGVYNTYMIPNNHAEQSVRLQELIKAIKRVYASTFFQDAKRYFKVTSYRLEEEKMAVVIQKLVGVRHGSVFYPDFAGVAKSHNFYPIEPQKSGDGIASVALGLGKTVAEGGTSVKFCPKFPRHLPQFSTIEDSLRDHQKQFYALNLKGQFAEPPDRHDGLMEKLPLAVAEADDTLKYVASTYSHENHTIYDGTSRQGSRIVSFAPILKQKLFPLPEILELLLEMGSWAMGTPVEIEFAGNISVPKDRPQEFGFLQMRPLVLRHEFDALTIEEISQKKLVCRSDKVMGNGVIKDIRDIVYIDAEEFDRFKSREVAAEVSAFNSKLLAKNRPYLLIGVGRWGSLDPLLGIPVKWDQISGAKVIVETGFKEIEVTPSQGSHFFHNLTSFMVGYFTISSSSPDAFINRAWLSQQEAHEVKNFCRLIRLDQPLTVKMNGRENEGVIIQPGVS